MADADAKVSALPAITALTTSDEILVNDGGVSKRITAADAGLFPKPAAASFRGALVHNSVDHTVPNNSVTALGFDTESYDTDGIHDNVTNNSRLTVTAGVTKVRLSGNLQWDSDSTSGARGLRIYKNGAPFSPGQPDVFHSASAFDWILNLSSAALTVVEGDYFELMGYHVAGNNLNDNFLLTWFAMEILE